MTNHPTMNHPKDYDPCPTDCDSTPIIHRLLDDLTDQINRLIDVVNVVDDRTKVICTPIPTGKNPNCPEEVKANVSVLADRIGYSTDRIITQRLRLQDILNTLEI